MENAHAAASADGEGAGVRSLECERPADSQWTQRAVEVDRSAESWSESNHLAVIEQAGPLERLAQRAVLRAGGAIVMIVRRVYDDGRHLDRVFRFVSSDVAAVST